MYWNKEIECMDREQLSKLQTENLKATAKKVYENVPFYKKAFDEKGIKPDDIKSLDDLKHLPFTVKNDLRGQLPVRAVFSKAGGYRKGTCFFRHYGQADCCGIHCT